MKDVMVMMAVATAAVLSFGADFSCNLQGEAKKPWTNLDFPDEGEFHFAILPDRTGGERSSATGRRSMRRSATSTTSSTGTRG